jgi:hypothetical protein
LQLQAAEKAQKRKIKLNKLKDEMAKKRNSLTDTNLTALNSVIISNPQQHVDMLQSVDNIW